MIYSKMQSPSSAAGVELGKALEQEKGFEFLKFHFFSNLSLTNYQDTKTLSLLHPSNKTSGSKNMDWKV